jgi:undecaprenyl-diphosphatase
MSSEKRHSSSVPRLVVQFVTLAVCIATPIVGHFLAVSAHQTAIETAFLVSIHAAPTAVVALSWLIAALFSPVASAVWIVIIAVAVLAVTKQWRPIAAHLATVLVPLAYVLIIKQIVNRPRPDVGVTTPGDPSFPSGHVAAAVSVVALVLLVMRRVTHGAVAWTLGCAVAAAFVLCVAASRLILGVHFPTDVATSLVVCPLIIVSIAPLMQRLFRVPGVGAAVGERTADRGVGQEEVELS